MKGDDVLERIPVLLLAAFLLCGCADSPSDSTSGSTQASSDAPQGKVIMNTYTEEETSVTSTETTTSAETSVTSAETTSAVTVTETVTTVIATEPPVPDDDGQLVLIKDYIPDIHLDLRYATTNNFTGKVIYENDDAYLCYGTVKKLMAVQEALREKGLSLIIWDPYRPPEAQEKLWEVCPNPTYVADPRYGITSHSRGNTVDLGIVAENGSYVPVPSDFDEFSLLADRNYADVSAEAAANSQMLEDIMTANGFKPYWGEWWHYSDCTEYNWHF